MLIAKAYRKKLNLLPEMSNRHGLIAGSTGCLSGSTIINFNRAKKGFQMPIEKAYKHCNQQARQLYNWDKSIPTYVRSFNSETIQLQEIDTIVYSGKKLVYSITLENGFVLEATPDHKIMTTEGWCRIDQLRENISMVMCDTLRATKSKSGKVSAKTIDKEVYGLPLHPFHQVRAYNQTDYPHTKRKTYAVMLHRLIYEAYINNLPLEEFISILKTKPEQIKKLKFTDPATTHIHHKDFNHYNNIITNLVCLPIKEHKEIHAEQGKYNFNQGIPYYSKVILVVAKSYKDTYDIICKEPYHNFVANGIVVHNSGKTVTLQVIAENFSRMGVPVFMADIKGDLCGIEFPGHPSEKITERLEYMGIDDFQFEGNPVRHWDVYSTNGKAIKTTITRMGALLLTRLLDLSEAQSGSLYQIFKIALDYDIVIRNLVDINGMITYILNNSDRFETVYGRISTASYGALQRSLLMLEDGGADVLFSKDIEFFDIMQFMQVDEKGRGVINILDATKLIQSPKVYATFLLWLLQELFEKLPEVGDVQKLKMAFFFDESHLLFDDAPKILTDKIERLVKLIRSKGVGIFFSTQAPADIPDGVLNQLGNRIQHALRAFTPREQKSVRTIAQTFRNSTRLNVERAIGELKIGEALVSFLDESGSPVPVRRALIAPPRSQIGVGK